MREAEAKRVARQFDLTAKGGVWYKARQSASGSDNWFVVRVTGDKERVYRR